MLERTLKTFQSLVADTQGWSIRIVDEDRLHLNVRQGVVEPPQLHCSRGAMITVFKANGVGYAATADLSESGLQSALDEASGWAEQAAAQGLLRADELYLSDAQADYATRHATRWDHANIANQLDLLGAVSARLKSHDTIVDWQSQLISTNTQSLLATSRGALIRQRFCHLWPLLSATASNDHETQRRSQGHEMVLQNGLESLSENLWSEQAARVGEEAVALLSAPNCPSDTRDLLLMPDQMVLQIHESIGHPLELDRILGDERNYAGGSFVRKEMFGRFQYGSEHLNISFAPDIAEEPASYACDDDGSPARRAMLIENGVLKRPLGGALSQHRAGMDGVACSRACSWNRPAIDRMANLNLEPGDKSLDELVSMVDKGILMDTNRSWSIDDQRNKFQFGCEVAYLIEAGQIKGLVKNPNYRGVSSEFWRNLAAVGDSNSFKVMGVGTCGKGEPSQSIHVGHASPACLFRAVEVFGGA